MKDYTTKLCPTLKLNSFDEKPEKIWAEILAGTVYWYTGTRQAHLAVEKLYQYMAFKDLLVPNVVESREVHDE